MAIFTGRFNVIGSTLPIVELVKPTEEVDIKTILITNVHDSSDASVDLFIQDDPTSGTTSTYYILKNINMPSGTSVLLDDRSIVSVPSDFGLYINIGGSDTVDVLIR